MYQIIFAIVRKLEILLKVQAKQRYWTKRRQTALRKVGMKRTEREDHFAMHLSSGE